MLLVTSKHESNFPSTNYYLQNTTDTKESLENELAKVTKDRDLSMKKKDELAGILSQAAQALRASLAVSYFFSSFMSNPRQVPLPSHSHTMENLCSYHCQTFDCCQR